MNAMRPIAIDFRRPAGAARTGIAMLLAGVFSTTAGLAWYAGIDSESGQIEAQMTDIKRMMRRAPGKIDESRRDAREIQQEVRMANTVIRQMTVPWDRLFAELESSAGGEVALLSVQPDIGNRIVRINGEAKSLNAMLDYSRRLENTDMLGGVVLLGHEVKGQDPQRPVVFAVSAGWGELP